ncbi:MAG: DUF861 domain-containing protein [Colwellia sp.]|nr:DUF861 domain-containing protein [Colwellia sp.]
MLEKRIIKLSQNLLGFGDITDGLDAVMFEVTQPIQYSHSGYEDKELGLYVGVLGSTDTADNAAPYARDEFIFIIEGAVEIKNNNTGKIETIKAGNSFILPYGYDYQWHQQGYLRKLYVIFETPKTLEQPVTENVIYINEKSDIPWQETSDGHRKKIFYQNNNQRFTAGIWQSKAFTTGLIDFPYHEFILIKDGSLICTDDSGVAHYFISGDALFIPQGTRCAWQVKNKVSIHFTQLK